MYNIPVEFEKWQSRPARGGWIEIVNWRGEWAAATSPAPQGAGGLKYCHADNGGCDYAVPPRKGRVD